MNAGSLPNRSAFVAAILGVGTIASCAAYPIVAATRTAHDKAIYATLQGIEIETRGRDLHTPVVLRNSGDAGDVLGVRSTSARFPYCWVSLTKTGADGEVMALDCKGWATHCDDIEAAIRGGVLPAPVRQFVAERCAKA
jgi:hypothetical protein